MGAMTPPGADPHHRQRWVARAALAAAVAAALLPLVVGGLVGLLLLAAALAGLVVAAAALWWVLSRRGPVRVAAGVLAVGAPAAVVALFAAAHQLWVIAVSLGLWAASVWCGRYALRSTGLRPVRAREHRTPPPTRPFLIFNPRSGGGKVERFGLREKAERLGARVVLLDPGHPQDVTALAESAVAEGADLLGVGPPATD